MIIFLNINLTYFFYRNRETEERHYESENTCREDANQTNDYDTLRYFIKHERGQKEIGCRSVYLFCLYLYLYTKISHMLD